MEIITALLIFIWQFRKVKYKIKFGSDSLNMLLIESVVESKYIVENGLSFNLFKVKLYLNSSPIQ